MRIVGFEPRGWQAARHNLLKLISPFYVRHEYVHCAQQA